MMNYDETNGNQPEYHEFLHFCHIDTPYNQSMSSIVYKKSESGAISLHRLSNARAARIFEQFQKNLAHDFLVPIETLCRTPIKF